MTDAHATIRLALEVGAKKSFASALDWPGWCRAGNGEQEAIAMLLSYRDRYNEVVDLAGLEPISGGEIATDVVDRVPGDATTGFGAPGKLVDADFDPLAGDDLHRHLALLRGAWTFFDRVASEVTPALRKGPRGGGRDRDKMIDHVLQAERSYARRVGLKMPQLAVGDTAAIASHRDAIVVALAALAGGGEVHDKGWPPRYAVRRMAWHVLDHAWEMEDKTLA